MEIKKSLAASIIIILIFIGGILWLANDNEEKVNQSLSDAKTPISLTDQQPLNGWREFSHEYYRFSLLYPQELNVTEKYEGGGATTIIFEDKINLIGFQIYTLPYRDEQISEERFRQDVPSGIRIELENFPVDGIPASSFYSEDTVLGETFEVWLIYKDYLYELTTLRATENLLKEIIKTWKFL